MAELVFILSHHHYDVPVQLLFEGPRYSAQWGYSAEQEVPDKGL